MRVQEGKGLDVKPPDLGEGGGLPLVAHMDGAPVVIQRVGASIQEEKNTCMHRSAAWSQAAAVMKSSSPVLEEPPHGVSRHRVGEAVPHAQGQRGVRGRLGDGHLHVHNLAQRKGYRELVLEEEGSEGRI
ncbi:hypothetical protein EYF80_031314 [Liparis tanakae]|uniref:Uncharacterized protein n=1 Tax=Liparis tanakae TaxID=230148 RepID=A0A4Z2GYY5_9TELE|nr:hypothetical protein EYF80_031314 [Liparis tanakae]